MEMLRPTYPLLGKANTSLEMSGNEILTMALLTD